MYRAFVQNKEPDQIAISALDEYFNKIDIWRQLDIPEYASEYLHKTLSNAACFKKFNLSTKNRSEKESLIMFQNKSRAFRSVKLELPEKRQEFETAREDRKAKTGVCAVGRNEVSCTSTSEALKRERGNFSYTVSHLKIKQILDLPSIFPSILA